MLGSNTAREKRERTPSAKQKISGRNVIQLKAGWDEARLYELIRALYDAFDSPQEWSAVLDEMSKALGAEGAIIVKPDAPRGCYASSARMRALVNAYIDEDWAARSPWLQRMKNRGLIDSVATEWNLFTPEELKREALYNELVLKNGFASLMTVVLSNDDDDAISLSFLRTPGQGQFTSDELGEFAKVLPALRRFGKLAAQFAAARDAGTGDSLDQMADGAILVDDRGRVLHINPAAKRYANDVVGIDRSGVHALSACAVDQLRNRLAQALGTTEAFTSGVAVSPVLLPRKSGRPILADVVPLQQAVGDVFRKGAAVIYLTDPDKPISVDEEICRHLFGLSPAEARLAQAVSCGEDISGFAKASGLAVDTIRKRTKNLLAKTGTRRQAELAALLGRLQRDVVVQEKLAG